MVTGSRVIVLNCFASAAEHVLDQAHTMGMMEAGWVWVVTDGTTGFVSLPSRLKPSRSYVGSGMFANIRTHLLLT